MKLVEQLAKASAASPPKRVLGIDLEDKVQKWTDKIAFLNSTKRKQ